ncbi:hypothetical protein [Leisingera sp. NJS204]|uniref:hypothetical protein n=1 Tax=Leisingera sp. NJS204 TaxID=2508307 RepID=UPI00101026F9|nr:hypothetical protein [Leisingera sp. NJS204]QAX29914.1 hypothetical protein ETW24_11335 [Leisingera sp. NJS204]
MTFSASTGGATATVTVTVLNSTANLKVENASDLGDQLALLVYDLTAHPIEQSPDYMVYATRHD